MLSFHIPDFRKNLRLNLILLDFYRIRRNRFIEGMTIEYIYDSFPLIWNGGRFVRGKTDFAEAEKTIRTLNEKGLKIAFTFTNSLLTAEHLKDPDCNRIMRLASGTGIRNSVIVNSPLLENYIRVNYPDFGIILSTTRQLDSASALNEALKRDYDFVVLDYNMNHDWDALSRIAPELRNKCEFLVNACCKDDCPFRGDHYREISRQQLLNGDPAAAGQIPFVPCRWERSTYFTYRNYRNFMGIREIREKYEPMGFCHMKLEGRDGDPIHLLENYVQYLVKEEYRDETRYDLLQFFINSRK